MGKKDGPFFWKESSGDGYTTWHNSFHDDELMEFSRKIEDIVIEMLALPLPVLDRALTKKHVSDETEEKTLNQMMISAERKDPFPSHDHKIPFPINPKRAFGIGLFYGGIDLDEEALKRNPWQECAWNHSHVDLVIKARRAYFKDIHLSSLDEGLFFRPINEGVTFSLRFINGKPATYECYYSDFYEPSLEFEDVWRIDDETLGCNGFEHYKRVKEEDIGVYKRMMQMSLNEASILSAFLQTKSKNIPLNGMENVLAFLSFYGDVSSRDAKELAGISFEEGVKYTFDKVVPAMMKYVDL